MDREYSIKFVKQLGLKISIFRVLDIFRIFQRIRKVIEKMKSS